MLLHTGAQGFRLTLVISVLFIKKSEVNYAHYYYKSYYNYG